MKKKYKDTDLREALHRREARRTKLQPSENFCDSVMQQIAARPANNKHWRWVAAAACLIVIIGIGATMWPTKEQTAQHARITQPPQKAQLAQTARPAQTTQLTEKTPQQKTQRKKQSPPRPAATPPRKGRVQRRVAVPPHSQMAAPSDTPTEDNAEMADTVRKVKEILQMFQPPRHYMAQMNDSVQADFLKMTREIRERGERMTRRVETAINDDAY